MQTIQSLNGEWQLTSSRGDALPAVVPGCVHTALLDAELIPDPFYRTQETEALWVGSTDWTYRRTFDLDETVLAHDAVLLRCLGLDTLATIEVNGRQLAQTDNMFRTYEFDVKSLLHSGQNEIVIHFQAPVPYAQARLDEKYLHNWGVTLSDSDDEHNNLIYKLPGGNYLRKEQCNFGWDWGLMVPTCGIWRTIELVGISTARLNDVRVRQFHGDGTVRLEIEASVERWGDGGMRAMAEVNFLGEPVAAGEVALEGDTAVFPLTIPAPQLWWPNGMGEQPLYDVVVELVGDGRLLDQEHLRIGLRTLRLVRQPDEWGESFHFEANGVPFFAKGANWIPADSFLDRLSADDYERLIHDSALVNMNMLRVWGGGIYEEEIFYELCDEYGICVWQDFMFACATYPTFDDAWMASVEQEARDNIKRLRHHASLALWCGNNELEQGLVGPEETETTMSWAEYGRLFDTLLPKLVQDLDPQTDYWPCSPHTPHGDRHHFNDPTCGDAHIWNVWHGLEPFEFYRTCLHRFNSEFGFQSFPEPRTVESFTEPDDRNITSFVMEHHQRSLDGNQRIMHYMLDWFRLPTSFVSTVWLSQIQQGMAIKYAVEHWRRTMPRGMGTLYWQLNDCWPVASWSSIDYDGRWKALHYMARHFFAPQLISAVEDVGAGTVEIHLTNDEEARDAVVAWQLLTVEGDVVENGRFPTQLPHNGSTHTKTLTLNKPINQQTPRNLLLHLELQDDENTLSENIVLFCRPKHLSLQEPTYYTSWSHEADGLYDLTIETDDVALWVWLETADLDCRLSDNFFHLLPGHPKTITLLCDEEVGLDEVKTAVQLRSLTDTYAE